MTKPYIKVTCNDLHGWLEVNPSALPLVEANCRTQHVEYTIIGVVPNDTL